MDGIFDFIERIPFFSAALIFAMVFLPTLTARKIFKVPLKTIFVQSIFIGLILYFVFSSGLISDFGTGIFIVIIVDIILIFQKWVFLWLPFKLKTEIKAEKVNSPYIENAVKWLKKRKREITAFIEKHKKKMGLAVGGFAVAILVFLGFSWFYNANCLKVIHFAPMGEVEGKRAIKVRFNGDFKVKTLDLKTLDLFKIEPSIEGNYEIKDREVLFIPEQDFRPSTRYQVDMDYRNLEAENKIFKQGFSFEFFSKLFKVEKMELKAHYEEMKAQYIFLAALDFNYPVSEFAVRNNVILRKKHSGRQLTYDVEFFNANNSVYLKSEPVQAEPGEYELVILSGLKGAGNGVPLEREIRETITISGAKLREDFVVEEVKVLNGRDGSYLGIRFSQAVEAVGLRSRIRLSPESSYEILAEKEIVLLKGDFKTGRDYELKVAKGVRSARGKVLKEDFIKKNIRIEFLKPYARFADKKALFSLRGKNGFRVESMNLGKIFLSVSKIHQNNLIPYLQQKSRVYEDPVFQGRKTVEISEEGVNKRQISKFDFQSVVPGAPAGTYVVRLYQNRSGGPLDEKIVLFSGTGTMAKKTAEKVYVWAFDPEKKNFLPGADVEIYSRSNALLYRGKTDVSGQAVFPRYKENREGYVAVVKRDGDFSFAVISGEVQKSGHHRDSMVDENRRFYAATDRLVYRPGEKVNVLVINRAKQDGRILKRRANIRYAVYGPMRNLVEKGDFESSVMNDLSLKIPDSGPGGAYTVRFRNSAGENLGTLSFRCIPFSPLNIRNEVEKIITEKEGTHFKNKVSDLSGNSIPGVEVKNRINFTPVPFRSDVFSGYRFHDEYRTVFSIPGFEMERKKTGKDGEAEYSIRIPHVLFPASALEQTIHSRALDISSQWGGDRKTFHASIYPYYLGIKPDETLKTSEMGENAGFYLIAVSPGGEQAFVNNIPVRVFRRPFFSILTENGIEWPFAEKGFETLMDKRLNVHMNAKIEFPLDKPGEYRVYAGEKKGHRASYTFSVPDKEQKKEKARIKITPNKKSYEPGESGFLIIESSVDGKCLVTFKSDGIYLVKIAEIINGSAWVEFEVDRNYSSTIRATAFLLNENSFNPFEENPADSSISIAMNPERGLLPHQIKAPSRVKDDSGIDLEIYLADPDSRVAVFAIEEGVMNISGYQIPNPLSFFYNRINGGPTVKNKKEKFDSEDERQTSESFLWQRHLNPFSVERKTSFYHYSGILRPGYRRRIRYSIQELKGFTGEIRLIVLGASGNRFFKTRRRITVEKDFSISTGASEFLGSGDRMTLPVHVFNHTGKARVVEIKIETQGPFQFKGAKSFKTLIQERGMTRFQGELETKGGTGIGLINIRLKYGEKEISKQEKISIRSNGTVHTLKKELTVGKEKEVKLPKGYFNGRGKTVIALSTDPLLKVFSKLNSLLQVQDREEKKSSLKNFPFIYFSGLEGSFPGYEGSFLLAKRRVQESIQRLEKKFFKGERQEIHPEISREENPEKMFHFLLEAKKYGFRVSERVLEEVKGFIRGSVLYRKQISGSGEKRIYTHFLKSYLGKPDMDEMEYLRKNKKSGLTSREKLLLALSYGLSGKSKKGRMLLDNFELEIRTRSAYYMIMGIPPEESGLHLYALSYLEVPEKKLDYYYRKLLREIEGLDRLSGRGSVWKVMALHRVSRMLRKDGEIDFEVHADGLNAGRFKGGVQPVELDYVPGKLLMRNRAKKLLYGYVLNRGFANKAKVYSGDNPGIILKREYRNIRGDKIQLASLKKGEMVLVTDIVKGRERFSPEEMIVVDILPAGLSVEVFPWKFLPEVNFYSFLNLMLAQKRVRADIREDRIIFSTERNCGEVRYTYLARAKAKGIYEIPRLYAEKIAAPWLHFASEQEQNLVVLD